MRDHVRRKTWASYPGATCLRDGCVLFRVWAPRCRRVDVQVLGVPARQPVAMAEAGDGWFEATLDGLEGGARYAYLLDGLRKRPDPASRGLPEGVHGPSEVVDTSTFAWTDGAWRGLSLFIADFRDPALPAAVTRGRREEFAAFGWTGGDTAARAGPRPADRTRNHTAGGIPWTPRGST